MMWPDSPLLMVIIGSKLYSYIHRQTYMYYVYTSHLRSLNRTYWVLADRNVHILYHHGNGNDDLSLLTGRTTHHILAITSEDGQECTVVECGFSVSRGTCFCTSRHQRIHTSIEAPSIASTKREVVHCCIEAGGSGSTEIAHGGRAV